MVVFTLCVDYNVVSYRYIVVYNDVSYYSIYARPRSRRAANPRGGSLLTPKPDPDPCSNRHPWPRPSFDEDLPRFCLIKCMFIISIIVIIIIIIIIITTVFQY